MRKIRNAKNYGKKWIESEVEAWPLEEYIKLAKIVINKYSVGATKKRIINDEDNISFIVDKLIKAHLNHDGRGTLYGWLYKNGEWGVKELIKLNKFKEDCDFSLVESKNNDYSEINDLLSILKPKQRDAIKFVVLENMTYKQASKAMGIGKQTVYYHLKKGLDILRERCEYLL